MISVETALKKVLSTVSQLEAERKPILDCLEQVLAEGIRAPFPVPPLDNAAMDGFAVAAADIRDANPQHPAVLKVIGEAAAGSLFNGKVRRGTAIRIMTGAPVPSGANAVVPFEETDEEIRRQRAIALKEIGIHRAFEPGANIRRAGEDIRSGSIVFEKGHALRPADIGVIASLGQVEALVIRRPVVAVLATGNEVIEVGRVLPPGGIYNSNSFSLAAQITKAGGIPKILGIARDSVKSLVTAIRRGLDCDLLLTTGGVSLGDYDLVKDVLANEGEISFWTVRMKPGKPLAFGTFKNASGRRIPHLGFPGNPVSAMTSFELFGRPAIRKMLGLKTLTRPTVKAVLESTINNRDRRRVFARVIVSGHNDKYYATLTGDQGSGILTSMSRANGLAVVPEDIPIARPGQEVDVIMLNWEEAQR
ncbi:MAG: gephyrin-like molybdotransferase Glp [Chloroflexota bacterium]